MFWSAFTDAFWTVLSLKHLWYLGGGVVLGTLIGILPGLGGIVGFSIMLPFLYGMDPTSALALLVGLIAVIPTSDTFTSVMMGIPGSSSSQATVLDGYPLAQQGQAARALSAAFSASLVGGLFGALVLTAFILFAKPLVLMLGSAELFMLGMLGISMVGVLSGDNIHKGILSCGLGILLGSVGAAPATGEWRLTFDSFYLFDGIKLVIIGLAMFALPEIVHMLALNKTIASDTTNPKNNALGSGWLQGIKDSWRYRWIIARCAPLGSMIGAIPGLGGSVVDWIAYGHVVQTSKDKSLFGKGDIRGVIAPESANNAKEGGGLVPTLLFGIPGSGSMAVFLGGLTILGIETGPSMLTNNLDLSYIIIWSLAIANVFGTILCISISKNVSRLTTIPYGLLAPFMIMIVCFAAFQANKSLADLVTLLAIGSLGCTMKFLNWSRPAFLIGFVLSDTLEVYLYQSIQFYGWQLSLRPIVIVIFLFILVSVFAGNFLKNKKSKNNNPNLHKLPFKLSLNGETLFVLFVLSLMILSLIYNLSLSFLGNVFPLTILALMTPSLFLLLTQLLNSNSLTFHNSINFSFQQKIVPLLKQYITNLQWFTALIVSSALLGFVISLVILFVSLIKVKTNASIYKTLLLTALAISLLTTMGYLMNLDFPTGLLGNALSLPWPLGPSF